MRRIACYISGEGTDWKMSCYEVGKRRGEGRLIKEVRGSSLSDVIEKIKEV